MDKKITAESTIMECLEVNPDAGEILQRYGMHCLGCALAHGETVAEAAAAHGNPVEDLLAELNKVSE